MYQVHKCRASILQQKRRLIGTDLKTEWEDFTNMEEIKKMTERGRFPEEVYESSYMHEADILFEEVLEDFPVNVTIFKFAAWLKDQETNLDNYDNLKSLRKILIRLYIIHSVTKGRVAIDIIDGKVDMIVYKVDRYGREDRTIIKRIVKLASNILLVTSTPFPQEFHSWWLGENYQVGTREFNLEGKLTVIVEDVHRGMEKTWNSSGNRTTTYTSMIRQLGRELSLFKVSRSKTEMFKLNTLALNFNTYARSTETEGSDAIEDFVLVSGLPYQNIKSEGYRKFMIARGIEEDDPKEAINKYRLVKTLQQLIQLSFRTAKVGRESGAVWFGSKIKDDDIIDLIHEYWPWSYRIKFIKLPRHMRSSEKVHFIIEELNGRKYLDRKSREILSLPPGLYRSKNQIFHVVGGMKKKILGLIDELVEKGSIKKCNEGFIIPDA